MKFSSDISHCCRYAIKATEFFARIWESSLGSMICPVCGAFLTKIRESEHCRTGEELYIWISSGRLERCCINTISTILAECGGEVAIFCDSPDCGKLLYLSCDPGKEPTWDAMLVN